MELPDEQTTEPSSQRLRRLTKRTASLRRPYLAATADHNRPIVYLAMAAIGAGALAVAAIGGLQATQPKTPPVVIVAAPPPPSPTPVPPVPTPTATPVPEATNLVHVSGRVVSPGVVEISIYERAIDAIALAGGALPDADLNRVNLAAPTFDGERIHVPAVGEEEPEVLENDRPEVAVPVPTPTFIPLDADHVADLGFAEPT